MDQDKAAFLEKEEEDALAAAPNPGLRMQQGHTHPFVLNATDREGRALFQTIFEVCPVPIAILRARDSRILDANDRFSELTGYSRDLLLGRTDLELGLWGDETPREALNKLLSRGQGVQDFEILVKRKDDTVRTTVASVQHISVGGEPCLLTVLTDITDRKQAELDLIAARDRAEEMARVKTSFVTNMTHEVRTPLTVILGFTSILRQGAPREHQRFIRAIERSGRRLLLMLDTILDLAQLEAGTIEIDHEPFNVYDLLTNIAQQVRPLAEEKGLSFTLNASDEVLYARSGHRIVARVLNNVLDNAIKFTEQGSIALTARSTNDHVEIGVQDTGIGIDPLFLTQAFEEFAQESTGLERTHQGSGLGLTVSRRLLKLVDGEINLESRKGKGSSITIRLPVDRSTSTF